VPDLLDSLREALADRYAVEREVGRGGMATVFLAQDLKHHRSVAIKVLHAELTAALGPERFLREIEIAARLQHPHILPLYDSGAAAGFLYYVMPYVEGESLRDRLTREKQLAQDDALRIATEVAGALAYAHSRGVVHRDIKPENIMLSGGTAVVTDFGIARAVSAAGEGQHLTETGTIIGTPAYMSPEQATGASEIDGRSDQYSLACVVYEMLVGEPPFTGPTAQAVIARHSLDMVSPPSIVRATIPDAVEGAILRGLSKVPADRYPTTALFAEALNTPSAATGAVRRATLAGTRGRGRPWRRELLAAVVVLIAAAVTGLLIRQRAIPRAGTEGGLDPRRVAVLYFEDLSPKKDLAHLADGLTEALISALSHAQGLSVLSKNAVGSYRSPDIPRDSVARALAVGTLVQGSVEETGSRYRVTVRLIDGASGADFKRAIFEQPAGDVLAIRDTLAGKVADFLRARLGEEVRLRETRAATHSVAAWSLLQRAEQARKRADALFEGDSLAAARSALQLADSLAAGARGSDPQWAEPSVLRAAIAYRQARLDFRAAAASPWIDKGLALTAEALKLDPVNPDALELRGTLHYLQYLLRLAPTPAGMTAVLRAAEEDLRTAVSLAPGQANAWYVLSLVNYQKPDFVEAKIDAQRAYEADAYLNAADQILWRLYTTSYDLEQFADAERWCAEGHRRFPDNPSFVSCQLWLMTSPAKSADVTLAWRLFDDITRLTPAQMREYGRLQAQIGVAAVLARGGLRDSARHVLERSKAGPDIDPESELLGFQAFGYLLLGDRDMTFRLLKEQVSANPAHRAGLARSVHWWWRDIRDDTRFKELVGTAH
jgi:serine/threonine-protein kinase